MKKSVKLWTFLVLILSIKKDNFMEKTYVITGSTSGIGKAVLEKLAANKENLIFAGYRNEKKLPQNIPDNIKYFYDFRVQEH